MDDSDILSIIKDKIKTPENIKNYKKNLCELYQLKIKQIEDLKKKRETDSKKIFKGDITIKNSQKTELESLKEDELIQKQFTNPSEITKMFEEYNFNGSSGEMLREDYLNRKKSISYTLLIAEYKIKIGKYQSEIGETPISMNNNNNNNNKIDFVIKNTDDGDDNFFTGGGTSDDDYKTEVIYDNYLKSLTDLNNTIIYISNNITFSFNFHVLFRFYLFLYFNEIIKNQTMTDLSIEHYSSTERIIILDNLYITSFKPFLDKTNLSLTLQKGGGFGDDYDNNDDNVEDSKGTGKPNPPENLSVPRLVKGKNLSILPVLEEAPQSQEEDPKEVELRKELKGLTEKIETFKNSNNDPNITKLISALKDMQTNNDNTNDALKKLEEDEKKLEDDEKIFNEEEKKRREEFAKLTENDDPIIDYSNIDMEVMKKYNGKTVIKKDEVENKLDNFIYMIEKHDLDSVPAWKKILLKYVNLYLNEPKQSRGKNVIIEPLYDLFNLVLVGTPGVGKSYTANNIGIALNLTGFLPTGNLISIKKPDIIGSYIGQTAPKVYERFTEGLGNVIFLDEAYSIAGKKNDKNAFDAFGTEAIDAITDFTSEHKGLMAVVAAGYKYEMKTQFIDVNAGMGRRFPNFLELLRQDVDKLWTIYTIYSLGKFPEDVRDFLPLHKAYFDILNLMFNYQCSPQPEIKLRRDVQGKYFIEPLGISYINLNIELSIESKGAKTIPLLNCEINTENTNINSDSVELIPYNELFKQSTNNVYTKQTITFLKSFILSKYLKNDSGKKILNGDLFRNQSDYMEKFGYNVLEQFISIPLEDFNQENNIRDLYFKLFFEKNPNAFISNMSYTEVDQAGGNSQMLNPLINKRNTNKINTKKRNILKYKKYTKKNIYRKGLKNTLNKPHTYKYKKNNVKKYTKHKKLK